MTQAKLFFVLILAVCLTASCARLSTPLPSPESVADRAGQTIQIETVGIEYTLPPSLNLTPEGAVTSDDTSVGIQFVDQHSSQELLAGLRRGLTEVQIEGQPVASEINGLKTTLTTGTGKRKSRLCNWSLLEVKGSKDLVVMILLTPEGRRKYQSAVDTLTSSIKPIQTAD